MSERIEFIDYEEARLISRVLHLYYLDELTQSQVAERLDLSASKVNRVLQSARRAGMVEIHLRTPCQQILELETQLEAVFGLPNAMVIPAIHESNKLVHTLGRAGASYLLEHLKDGDVIAIGGGTGIQALVEAVESPVTYDVSVVPFVGGLQGQIHTDVNYLADALARRLGGRGYHLHAPVLVDSAEQRASLLEMGPIKDILDIARGANIALMGLGTMEPARSHLVQFTALSTKDLEQITELSGGVGEVGGYIYTREGAPCAPETTGRLVGLTLSELDAIPHRIAIAATAEKSLPIYGALRGKYLHTLITDETAAGGALTLFRSDLSSI